MTAIVFAGPSIYPQTAEDFPDLQIAPPAAKGDLLRAARDGASAIGLIDGLFDTAPSVWHKEILFCISSGIEVLGGASMGALRAAECASYGMTGIGRVFEEYASGQRVSDGDVAILHCPAAMNFRPLSVALVDVETILENKSDDGSLNDVEHNDLRMAARRIHFKERTWRRIFLRSGIPDERLQQIFDPETCLTQSQKRSDALELIGKIRSRSSPRTVHQNDNFDFQNSFFFANLNKSVQAR